MRSFIGLSIIPLPYYTAVFYNVTLLIVLFAFIKLLAKGYVIYSPKKKEYASLILLVAVTLYMGLRPVSGKYFGDMIIYKYRIDQYAIGSEFIISRDILWQLFEKISSSIMTAQLFFILCAMLYVVPLYKAAKNWLGVNRYFLFLMFIASFSFWSYGTNGIRNGVANVKRVDENIIMKQWIQLIKSKK